jgi:hypothetical protein
MKEHLAETELQTPRELLPVFYKQYQLNDDGGQSSSYASFCIKRKYTAE